MARNPLKRLSMALGLGSAANGVASTTTKPLEAVQEATTLSDFLASTKKRYLQDINDDDGDRAAWTVSMGNEAGDLDSLASSIAFAWLHSTVNKKQTVPLIQIQKEDFHLREENLYALSLAGLKNPVDALVTSTDVESFIVYPSHRFALVDHNRLGNRFSEGNTNVEVVAVIDHHEDEDLYESAHPRIIAPAGSCSSHVALYLQEAAAEIPEELATLLLCAILIDTGGLKPGGKALRVDYDAASFLVPISTYNALVPPTVTGDSLYDAPALRELTNTLLTKKSDISRLSGLDLLRRDYKEASYQLQWAPNQPTIKAGLSSVPSGLASWATKGRLLEASIEWMKKRDLTILGVLTSFREEKKFGKGKHRREQIWILREHSNHESSCVDLEALADRLFKGLKDSDVLKLKKQKKFELVPKKGKLPKEMKWKAYKQGNVDATRKATAPLLKKILEGESLKEAVANGDAVAQELITGDGAASHGGDVTESTPDPDGTPADAAEPERPSEAQSS